MFYAKSSEERVEEDAPLLGRDDERRIWNKIVGRFDSPAYVRRAKKVEHAYQVLLQKCEKQRDEWLQPVRLLLGILKAQAGNWENLHPILVEADVNVLQQMWIDLQPELRSAIPPSRSTRVLRRAAQELIAATERFNSRWTNFLDELDLTHINDLRDGYNRYYILEKECYLRSPMLARKGFQPLSPMKNEELLTRFPPLPIPRLS